MKFAHFFIDRPIFAAVISIIFVLAGARGDARRCRSRSIPDITPPQITVSRDLSGRERRGGGQNVAAPIEQQVNGADNMIYMNSTRARRRAT